jgi:thioredoxin 1
LETSPPFFSYFPHKKFAMAEKKTYILKNSFLKQKGINMSEIILNKENFDEEVLKAETPALIDFWADWCGPCKMLAPIIEEIAREYDGRLKVCKVNVDEESALAQQYEVMSIPTLIVYHKGKMVRRQAGAAPKQAVIQLFSDLIP